MASMLESIALWRKEDLRLGYVWIGVGIFARSRIGTFEKKEDLLVCLLASHGYISPLQNLVTE